MRLPHALLAVLLGPAIAFGQTPIQLDPVPLLKIAGVDSVKVYEDVGVVLIDPAAAATLTTVPVVTFAVDAPENAQIQITVTNKDRAPTEFKRLDNRTYMISTPGKHWITVTVVDFAQQIFDIKTVVIEVKEPEPPAPVPDPEPDKPVLPEDGYDNIGQRVAKWTEGLPSCGEVAAVYREGAEKLRTSPSSTITSVGTEMNVKFGGIDEIDQFESYRDNLNADLTQRWPLDKDSLAAYYEAVAVGLEANK